jgi:hypothetical protein
MRLALPLGLAAAIAAAVVSAGCGGSAGATPAGASSTPDPSSPCVLRLRAQLDVRELSRLYEAGKLGSRAAIQRAVAARVRSVSYTNRSGKSVTIHPRVRVFDARAHMLPYLRMSYWTRRAFIDWLRTPRIQRLADRALLRAQVRANELATTRC